MQRRTFSWGRSKNKKLYCRGDNWIDELWIVGLLLAAVILFGINLGELPLRDWDEGTVAQVAREIWRAPAGSWTWLYPTLGVKIISISHQSCICCLPGLTQWVV